MDMDTSFGASVTYFPLAKILLLAIGLGKLMKTVAQYIAPLPFLKVNSFSTAIRRIFTPCYHCLLPSSAINNR